MARQAIDPRIEPSNAADGHQGVVQPIAPHVRCQLRSGVPWQPVRCPSVHRAARRISEAPDSIEVDLDVGNTIGHAARFVFDLQRCHSCRELVDRGLGWRALRRAGSKRQTAPAPSSGRRIVRTCSPGDAGCGAARNATPEVTNRAHAAAQGSCWKRRAHLGPRSVDG